jgi:hypothetical protein
VTSTYNANKKQVHTKLFLIALLFYHDYRTKTFAGEKHQPVKIHLNVPLKSPGLLQKNEFFYFHFAPLGSLSYMMLSEQVAESGLIWSKGKL